MMQRRYNVLRVGGLNISASRFIDFLEKDEVNSLTIIDFEDRYKYITELRKSASFFRAYKVLEKLNFRTIKSSLRTKIILKLVKIKHIMPNVILREFLYRDILSFCNHEEFDFIWVGDNDFDGSNLLFYLFHKNLKNKPFIRSYKETRFIRNRLEKYMLENSNALILPDNGYLDFFKRLYSIELQNVHIADLDWRYSKLADFVKGIDVQKLSSIDGKPHVCILTGRALSDPSEERSGFRYYFVPIVRELVKRGIYVHLHALSVIPSQKYGNVYEQIARESQFFKIEKALELTAYSGDYQILKRYDAGILHNPVPLSARSLYEFQKINIPNRLYEYQMADVVPVSQRNVLPTVEKVIAQTNFGIIYDDYDDLSEKLKELIKGNYKNTIERQAIKDFRDFSDVLLQIVEKLV